MKGISGNKGMHKLNNYLFMAIMVIIYGYLWLHLNKTKTGRNHLKNSINTTYTIFFSKSHSRSDDSHHYFFK
jgi:hypothetical protein